MAGEANIEITDQDINEIESYFQLVIIGIRIL